MSSDEPAARERLLAVAARRLKAGTSPYWVMTGFLFLAGVVGFVASAAMLRAGVDRMPVRYPLAVAAGYLAFLGLLWLWLRDQRDEGGEGSDLADAAYLIDAVTPRRRRGSVDLPAPTAETGGDLGLPSLPTIEGADSDGCGWVVVAVLVTVAIVGVLFAAVYAVVVAPTLLAELLVDGLVVGSLPKRRTRHWTRTALRRTGWGALGLAVLLGLVGWGAGGGGAGGAHDGPGDGFRSGQVSGLWIVARCASEDVFVFASASGRDRNALTSPRSTPGSSPPARTAGHRPPPGWRTPPRPTCPRPASRTRPATP